MPIDVKQRKVSLGLGMLSWRAPVTVDHALASYARENIFPLFDQVLIYFQDISDADSAVARKYGLACAGNDQNRGIYGGVKALLEEMQTEYVLFLENDCELIEPAHIVKEQLARALTDLVAGRAQAFRLRHLRQPGEDFATVRKYLRYHSPSPQAWYRISSTARLMTRLRALLRPRKAERLKGTAAYVEPAPDKCYPETFVRSETGNLIASSRHLNWTNQSVLFNRHWFLEQILPWVAAHPSRRTVNGFPDIEKGLNNRWWRQQDYKLGLTDGLFTHRRIDR